MFELLETRSLLAVTLDPSTGILTVDGTGKVNDFALDNVKYARINLPSDDKTPINLVTDVTWTGV